MVDIQYSYISILQQLDHITVQHCRNVWE